MTQTTDQTNATLTELMGLFGEIPADDLEIVKERLERRFARKQADSYHQMLLDRIFPRRDKAGQKLVPVDQPYRQYRVMAGKHYQQHRPDIEAARKEHEELCAKLAQKHRQSCDEAAENRMPEPVAPRMPEYQDPAPREFGPNFLVTPQSDHEAFMMHQDPEKFRPVGAPSDELAVIVAEANAAKSALASRDAEIAELRAQLEAKA